MTTQTLSQALAEFITDLDTTSMPQEVIEKARTCLLNGYSIGLAGLGTPYEPVARQAAAELDGGARIATLFGNGSLSSVTGAILANGALFHGRAQEDTCGAAHLGAVVIPLLTALIEVGKASPEDMIPALVAGYECGGLFEELLATHTTPQGFRATTLYGVMAAAAASARAMKFTATQTSAAIGNAVSFSGGLLQPFVEGTDEWRYQVGTTAQLGWTAAELARAGSISTEQSLEGARGLAAAFAGQQLDVVALSKQLGESWQTLRVAFKPFPVCAFNQTPVTAALELRERIKDREIASVEVRMNPYECGYAGMDAHGPFHSISGTLMSIPFCVALTLLRSAPSMKTMTTYDDAAVNALDKQITLISDGSVAVLSCDMHVSLKNGSQEHLHLKMTPEDYAYDFEDLRARLKAIAAQEGLPEACIDQLAGFCAAPETEPFDTVQGAFQMARNARA